MGTIYTDFAAAGSQKLISEGDSFKFKRVYRQGVISLVNLGKENSGILVQWKNDVDEKDDDNQFTLEIPPGASMEFEMPGKLCSSQFLDVINVDLVCGGPIEVSCLVPIEQLN